MAVDPVCGMTVDPQTAKHKAIHQGRTYFFCRSGCKAKFESDPGHYLREDEKSAPCCCTASEAEEDAVTDPVCGMTVNPHTAKYRADYEERPTYFCSAGCKAKFESDPKRYLEPNASALPPVPEGAIYTCPMHPEIRQAGPGSCPICG
ncbi:MAG TPA: YHS domain-containing protein, partial [Geobacterales bacterium]|nr:YHS domain-containing protein [Geobacterales bacterium]